MLLFIIMVFICLADLQAIEHKFPITQQEQEFKIYIDFPNGESHELPYNEYQSLLFIENSLIRQLVTQNATYQDIHLLLPLEFAGMHWVEVENFLHFVRALYGYFVTPPDYELLKVFRQYLDAFKPQSFNDVIQYITNFRMLSVSFQYHHLRAKLDELLSLLASPLAHDIVALSSQVTQDDTPIDILQKMSTKNFTSSPEVLHRAKIITFILGYTPIFDAFARLIVVVESLDRLIQITKGSGRRNQAARDEMEELEAKLEQAITELSGFVEPTDIQLMYVYDFLLRFFSDDTSSYHYRKIKELAIKMSMPRK